MTEKCTKNTRRTLEQLQASPFAIHQELQCKHRTVKSVQPQKNHQQRFSQLCLLAGRRTVPLGRQKDGTTRCISSAQDSVWDVSRSGHFACNIWWLYWGHGKMSRGRRPTSFSDCYPSPAKILHSFSVSLVLFTGFLRRGARGEYDARQDPYDDQILGWNTQGFDSCYRQHFSPLNSAQSDLGPNRPVSKWYKLDGNETDHRTPTCAEVVKNAWSYTPSPSNVLTAWRLHFIGQTGRPWTAKCKAQESMNWYMYR